MSGFKCPFCGEVMAITSETAFKGNYRFDGGRVHDITFDSYVGGKKPPADFILEIYKCPSCLQQTIKVTTKNIKGEEYTAFVKPTVQCEHFPDYVPNAIRQDYEEANAIAMLSPKASATLSRRCLQGMIHDFWAIDKGNLLKEINELEGKVPAEQWRVIDGLRRLGNIGAHMEKDVDIIVDIEPGEAQKLIKLIELLIKDWYINRYEQQQLYSDILAIDAEKQGQRKPSGSNMP